MKRVLLAAVAITAAVAPVAAASSAPRASKRALMRAHGRERLVRISVHRTPLIKGGGVYCPASRAPYHGAAGARYTISAFGITLAWIQVEQEYWCWVGPPHHGNIVGWGQVIGRRYVFPGYCWADLQLTDQFWNRWERKAEYEGKVGLFKGETCVGVRSVNARLYYRAGGGANHG